MKSNAALWCQSFAIGVDGLPEKGHLSDSTVDECLDLIDNLQDGSADFLAAGSWHDTKGTGLITSSHHGDESLKGIGPKIELALEFEIRVDIDGHDRTR